MAIDTNKGMNKVHMLCQDRTYRVNELRQEGKKIFGYLCLYPVIEMLTALDIVPFRLFGDIDEPITKTNNFLPTVVCPFLRSFLDLGLKGKYGFLDGIVTAHNCDVGSGIPEIWNYNIHLPYAYHLDTPHTIHESSLEKHRLILDSFRLSLEKFTGQELTPAKLAAAINLHNEQRALVRELYNLKKLNPPLVSGAETIRIIKAVQSLPAKEANQLLKEVITEVKKRPDKPVKKGKRLMIWGSILDNTSLVEMIEQLDANVVMDDTCVGSRAFFNDVKLTADPFDGLAEHYLKNIKCPRTFIADYYAHTKNYSEDLKVRFGYLGEYAHDWQVNGVILEALRYCDTHGYEVPAIKDYFKQIGVPAIYLEHDYTRGVLSQLTTRVEGFLEIIDQNYSTV
jgi:benzoyl-CoA reductase subunit C